jgi:hypothetical protein
MNIFNIERAFSDKTTKKWEKLFICVDLHDTIIQGKYSSKTEDVKYLPNAINVLRNLSKRKDIVLILWTSSHVAHIKDILDQLEKQRVYFKYVNCNPECPDDKLCDFGHKFYMNIGLDDKFGFDGLGGDWFLVEKELKRIGEWKE